MTVRLDPRQLGPATYRRLPAAAVLVWAERALPAELGWVVLGWTLFGIAALFDIGRWMPGQARLALLAGFIVASAALLAEAARRIPRPSLAARLARLERGGGLKRGLLSLAAESPAGATDIFAARLWQRAQREAHRARPRFGRPEWHISEAVRYGLLPLIGTALLLGLLAAKAQAPARLARAFSPYAESLAGLRFVASVEAPAYAGLPARRLAVAGGGKAAVAALPGSRVTLRGEGLAGSWRVERPDGRRYPAADGTARFPLDFGGIYRVRWGHRTAATLRVALAADSVPVVRFTRPVARTASGALRLSYRLLDDHGASALSLRLSRGGEERATSLDTSVPSGTGDVFADLTPHPWAGETVMLRLAATDGAGHTGLAPRLRITLPERKFTNPAAREIIAIRKRLLRGGGRQQAVAALTGLAAEPRRFGEDLAVYAGLRAAAWRLLYDRGRVARESTADLLWDIAADLEDGGASRAMDDLRRAMERLSKQLGTGDDRALAGLADQLEKAMSEYLRRQIQAALAAGEPPPPAAGKAPTVDLGFLDQMFADLKARLAAGDTEGAAKALANLRQLMENIRFGGAPDPEAAKRAEAAGEIARALRDLEGRQGGLRDQTIADLVRQQFMPGSDLMRQGAAGQRELSRALAGLRKKFGAAGFAEPRALADAQAAMAEAAAALGRGDGGGAVRAQTRALDALGKAAGEAEASAQRLADMAGPGAMQPGAAGSGLDPLGRPGTGFGQGAVKLPDQMQVRRIQEIRKILEDRASDPSRGPEERGYYLRLLKRF